MHARQAALIIVWGSLLSMSGLLASACTTSAPSEPLVEPSVLPEETLVDAGEGSAEASKPVSSTVVALAKTGFYIKGWT